MHETSSVLVTNLESDMINHKYRAVFVRVARTASTTFEKTFKDQDAEFVHVPAQDYPHDPNHLSAQHIMSATPETKNYFKFAVVRNPYDRLVSGYRYYCVWMKHFKNPHLQLTFSDFVHNIHEQWTTERVKYTDQHTQTRGCDYIGRYETLRHSYEHVCSRMNIAPIELVDRNRTQTHWFTPMPRKQHDNYQDYYDSDTKKLATLMNEQDLHVFEYKF
jgi:chondroitin 4-sulfotransferase 11